MSTLFSQLNAIPVFTPKPKRASRKSDKTEDGMTETDLMFLNTLIGLGGEAETTKISRAVTYCASNALKYMRRLEEFGKVTCKEVKIRESTIRSRKLVWTVVENQPVDTAKQC